mgnify:FL=1
MVNASTVVVSSDDWRGRETAERDAKTIGWRRCPATAAAWRGRGLGKCAGSEEVYLCDLHGRAADRWRLRSWGVWASVLFAMHERILKRQNHLATNQKHHLSGVQRSHFAESNAVNPWWGGLTAISWTRVCIPWLTCAGRGEIHQVQKWQLCCLCWARSDGLDRLPYL